LKSKIFTQRIILFLIIFSTYFLLDKALFFLTSWSGLISAAAAIIFYLIFSDSLLNLTRKLTSKEFYRKVTAAGIVLNNLNRNLNRARHYDEVTNEIFSSLEELFDQIPCLLYILKNEKFRLAYHVNINDPEFLSLDIDASYLKGIERKTLKIKIADNDLCTAKIKEHFISNELNDLLPFHGHEQIFAFLAIDYEKIVFFNDPDTLELFRKIQRKTGIVLENKGLLLDLEKKHDQTRKLIEISQKILSAFDTKQVLDFILESLKSLIDFDAASIFLLDKSGRRLLNTSHTGYDNESIINLPLKVGQGACGWTVETREIDVVDDVRTAEHYYSLRNETKSQISIPLIYDNDVLGVLCLESDRLAFFNQSLTENLQLFAHFASLAIHNARQMNVLLTKRALEHELIDAGIVQKQLLVQHPPSIQNLKITALNIPSILVSGDLYDIIKYNDSTLGVAIGDVSGKGAAAALMMTLILAGLRSHKRSFNTACDVVYRLNNLLFESTTDGKFATFFFAIVSTEKNKLVFTNAGHNDPILIKADGEIVRLHNGGIVLGFQPDWEYIQEEIDFGPGDLFVGFTDGVTEIFNKDEEEFGDDRLVRLVNENRNKSVYELKSIIIDAVNAFAAEDDNRDDVTLVIFKNDVK